MYVKLTHVLDALNDLRDTVKETRTKWFDEAKGINDGLKKAGFESAIDYKDVLTKLTTLENDLENFRQLSLLPHRLAEQEYMKCFNASDGSLSKHYEVKVAQDWEASRSEIVLMLSRLTTKDIEIEQQQVSADTQITSLALHLKEFYASLIGLEKKLLVHPSPDTLHIKARSFYFIFNLLPVWREYVKKLRTFREDIDSKILKMVDWYTQIRSNRTLDRNIREMCKYSGRYEFGRRIDWSRADIADWNGETLRTKVQNEGVNSLDLGISLNLTHFRSQGFLLGGYTEALPPHDNIFKYLRDVQPAEIRYGNVFFPTNNDEKIKSEIKNRGIKQELDEPDDLISVCQFLSKLQALVYGMRNIYDHDDKEYQQALKAAESLQNEFFTKLEKGLKDFREYKLPFMYSANRHLQDLHVGTVGLRKDVADFYTDLLSADDFDILAESSLKLYNSMKIQNDAALHEYGLEKSAELSGWSLSAEDDDGTDVSVASRSTYSSVCRGLKAEMWWISTHGSVEGMYNNSGKWVKYHLGGPDCGASGGIAAVSQDPAELHVFWNIQSGQRIMGAKHTEADGWSPRCVEADARATGKGSVAALSRATGKMEIWWADKDGAIQGRWHEEALHGAFSNTWDKYVLAPAGSATPNSSIAAYSHHAGHMEVFWIALDGAVKGKSYKDSEKGWSTPIYIVAPKSSASLESPISVTASFTGEFRIFFISASGSPQYRSWHWGHTDFKNGMMWPGYSLAPEYSARVDSDIKAIYIDKTPFVFWVGANNSLVMATPYQPKKPVTLLAQPGEVKPGSPIGAFKRPGVLSVAFTTHWETTVILEKTF